MYHQPIPINLAHLLVTQLLIAHLLLLIVKVLLPLLYHYYPVIKHNRMYVNVDLTTIIVTQTLVSNQYGLSTLFLTVAIDFYYVRPVC